MKLQTLFITAIFTLALFSFSSAQDVEKIDPDKAVEWTFEEKVKLSPEQILNYENDQEKKQKIINELKRANNDVPVSNNPDVEAEIHAAINPTDSSNIVISPIKMVSSQSGSSINCPVYYTNNFGQTWNESNFVNMPYVSGGISGGGGDPVFAFDKNGKLYFVWIDLYASDPMDFISGTANMGIFWAYSNDGGQTFNQPAHDTILLGEMQMSMGQPSQINSPISDKEWLAVDMSNSNYSNNLYISYVTIDQVNQQSSYQIKVKTKPDTVNKFTKEANVTDTAEFPFVQFGSITVDNSGDVHVFFYGTKNNSQMALWHSVSSDGGSTFSQPDKISNVKLDLKMFGLSSYNTIPGINPDRLYPSNYGTCDPVTGDLYVTWTAFGVDSDNGTGSDIYFSKLPKGDTAWTTPKIINDDPKDDTTHNYYSTIFVDNSGTISLSWYDRREDDVNNIETHYYGANSTDNGATFSNNYKITSAPTDFSTVGDENQGFGIGEYTQILSTPTGYNTIPIWVDGRTNDGNLNVYIAFINDQTVGLPEIKPVSGELSVKDVYPNPAQNNLNVKFSCKHNSDIKISLMDINGRKVRDMSENNFNDGEHKVKIDVSGVSAGKYLLHIQNDNSYTTKPVVISR